LSEPSSPALPADWPADFVFKNGKIVTVDARDTIAQAIAIAGDRILAVGPDAAMAAHIATGTHVTDLAGRCVVPGLTDGHAHMDREGLRAVFPSLGPVRSIRDIQDRIAELARGRRPGEWIVTMPIGEPPFYFGVPECLAERRWPVRQELDAAAPGNPVYIRAIWGYWRGTAPIVSCANTAALRHAGVGRDTISPVPALTIEKDANGDPTGVFVEDEMQPVAEMLWFREATRFTHEDRRRALAASMRAYHAAGTTGIYEGHGVADEVLRVYREARREGSLTIRSALAFSADWSAADETQLGEFVAGLRREAASGDAWLKMDGLYVHLGRSEADDARARAAPYTGWAGFNAAHGLPRERAKELLLQCARQDVRAAAIAGGGGLGMLDLFEEVDREIPLKGRRWVLSHVNVISPRDVERIARLGLVLTTHTNAYLGKALGATAARLPRERHGDIVPMRSLREAGITVSLATDNVPVSLWHPVAQTVMRRDPRTQAAVAPEQALSRMEVLRCATANGAYLTFDEAERGTLEPGKLADLAVLSGDPLTAAEERLSAISAVMTMTGGRAVHGAPEILDSVK